jgi:predicted nucleic acid-binding protein
MILLDTSILVDSLCGSKHSERSLTELISSGVRVRVPAIVFYEWLRGPRIPDELEDQEDLLPSHEAIPFEHAEAVIAAQIYRSVRSPRSREIDIAIAATAMRRDAFLWTLNRRDFEDIPGLRLL